ncbi:hypothetical protein DIPPA_62613 [Diplonema papillatum]|nr:hypothetical protein DIPPA_62613 [Diplonema papillatum]
MAFAHPKGSMLNYMRAGCSLMPVEYLPLHTLPVLYFALLEGSMLQFLKMNLIMQSVLFLLVVCIPAHLTQKMIYVDIGWPVGLCVAAVNLFCFGDGWWVRRDIMSLLLLLHGGRMAVGGIFMFGRASKWTFLFEKDLPRYQYAKWRWLNTWGMPESGWMLKMHHDLLQQGCANIFGLPAAFLLTCFNKDEYFGIIEVFGILVWCIAYVIESAADLQKLKFISVCKRQGKGMRNAVLGYSPFDGSAYWLWTRCRHPNYFGEWCCWGSYAIIGAQCFVSNETLPSALKVLLGIVSVYNLRMLYDCLVYWTGSEPAEFFSVQKRPDFSKYQETTRVFFPFEVPFVDHHKKAFWPVEAMTQ